MLISEYLQMRMNVGSALPSSPAANEPQNIPSAKQSETDSLNPSPFAVELQNLLNAANEANISSVQSVPTTAEQLEYMTGINFSRHAVERINERNIDVYSSDRLSRLSKGVELAESKGSDDTLVIVDSTAFVVSVKNNKVITAVNANELQGNVFTNIDSTVIM